MIKSQQVRNDKIFMDCVWELIRERIKRSIDKHPESYRRITKAIGLAINKNEKFREILIMAEMPDDRRNNNGYE